MRLRLPVVTSVALTLGFFAGLSCGPQVKPCGPSTCATGCCDAQGECLSGSGLLACGAGGAACAVCAANETCAAGVCGAVDGGDYDASFPDAPDAHVNYDAGVFDGGLADAGPDGGGVDAGRPDAGPTGDGGVSYIADVAPIFAARCNGSCHQWSRATLVNQMGSLCPGHTLVVPGDAGASLLYEKVSSSTPSCGSQMPQGGSLSATELHVLQTWVIQGALDN
jgi:hypothetical protein